MWRHQTPSSASTMLPPIRFDQRLSFKLWQITFGWKIQIVGRITSNCWQDKFKLLTSKCWQDGSVSSLRNSCLPLHHRAGDPAVGGSVSHSPNQHWLSNQLKVGTVELVVVMFNGANLWQVSNTCSALFLSHMEIQISITEILILGNQLVKSKRK